LTKIKIKKNENFHIRMNIESNSFRMCIRHNRACLLHLLEEVDCDGFCLAADPCENLRNRVKKCKKCGLKADPVNTEPGYNGDGFVMGKNETEISVKEVSNYANKRPNSIEKDVNKTMN
jgi:hypothetical protein